MKRFITLLFLSGCISQSTPQQADNRLGLYTGYSYSPSGSTGAQVTVWSDTSELRATVSIDGSAHPFDIFLFKQGSEYIGSDSSYGILNNEFIWTDGKELLVVKK